MCGIVGYVGNSNAYSILIKGLKRLEYRGYDSAGLALINEAGDLNIYKTKGKVSALEYFSESKDISGTIGIAHTRWATHGEANDVNSHPHYSQSENLALVHNGIIENYALLRKELEDKGNKFRSDTDSEVLIYLIEYMRESRNVDSVTATRMALDRVTGSFAIAVLDKDAPDTIIAARKSSPLVIGLGEDAFYLASDTMPISEYTEKVVYMNDDEIAVIKKGIPLRILNKNQEELTPVVRKSNFRFNDFEKGEYSHFMLKEIFEQPEILSNCIKGRINADFTEVVLSGVVDNREKFENTRRIIFVACGTSWHAALIGERMIEDFCRLPVEVEYASEFRYRNPVIYPDDIVIAVSQSGETADTLAALEIAKSKGAFTYGICNVEGSSLARLTDSCSHIHAGPEMGVASTKAFTGQVMVLTMLALCMAEIKGTMDENKRISIIGEIRTLPQKMRRILEQCREIEDLAKIFTYAHNFIYVGRGYDYPVALEGALKLKEISYIHAEGYPAAEMKHGPIALIDSDMPVLAIAVSEGIYEKTLSNIEEIKARNGKIISIVKEGDERVKAITDYCIEIPAVSDPLFPMLAVIPLQLLAYHIALRKGKDVDQPRNLAKSVTVE